METGLKPMQRVNFMSCVCSIIQDRENVFGWSDAYTIASNGVGDNPGFSVDYKSHFEPYAKWIWARSTEGTLPRSRGSASVTGLNCAFCRADQLAKQLNKANVRGKCVYMFDETTRSFWSKWFSEILLGSMLMHFDFFCFGSSSAVHLLAVFPCTRVSISYFAQRRLNHLSQLCVLPGTHVTEKNCSLYDN